MIKQSTECWYCLTLGQEKYFSPYRFWAIPHYRRENRPWKSGCLLGNTDRRFTRCPRCLTLASTEMWRSRLVVSSARRKSSPVSFRSSPWSFPLQFPSQKMTQRCRRILPRRQLSPPQRFDECFMAYCIVRRRLTDWFIRCFAFFGRSIDRLIGWSIEWFSVFLLNIPCMNTRVKIKVWTDGATFCKKQKGNNYDVTQVCYTHTCSDF